MTRHEAMSRTPVADFAPAPATSRAAHEAYCRRQAMRLLALLPSGAVRPLYARARAWATERGIHEGKDPLATLRGYCRELLPLPPYRAWVADVLANPDAHARAPTNPGSDDDVAGEPDPVTVEVRPVRHDAETWYASLNVAPGDDAWRGFIAFHRGPDSRTYRTADVFRETTADDVRSRFRGFDDEALRAFLRSVLP